MRTVSISLQTAKDIRQVLKMYVCKNKKSKECEFSKLDYIRTKREICCSMCPIKCLDKKLKEEIFKGEK